jgi:hypothetical protein
MVFLFSPRFLTFAAVLAAVVYMTPSVLRPTVWMDPPPARSMDGVLTPNSVLERAVAYHEGNVLAPESMAFHPVTGDVYATLGDGRIVVMSETGEFLRNLLFVGGIMAAERAVAGQASTLSTHNGLDHVTEINFCTSEYVANRLPWNTPNEENCG